MSMQAAQAALRGEELDENSPEIQELRAAHLLAIENLLRAIHAERQRTNDGDQVPAVIPEEVGAAGAVSSEDDDDDDDLAW